MDGAGAFVCVPLQGSGTFAVEAAIGTLVPRDGKLLVLVNGAYGERMARLARTMGRDVAVAGFRRDQPGGPRAGWPRPWPRTRPSPTWASSTARPAPACCNPLEAVARVVQDAGRRLIVDAMSSFGVLPAVGPGHRRWRR